MTSSEVVDAAAEEETAAEFTLRLYVAGQSPRSVLAIDNLHRVCQTYLAGRYRVEVIDLVEHPSLARDDQIIAVPTLVRRTPLPVRKVIGDLSDTGRVLSGLDIVRGEAPR